MKYRVLGKTGLRCSVIGVGTWQLGGEWNKTFAQPEVDDMCNAARGLGINFVDTAECYGDHESERLIGAAVEQDRKNWIIATKFGHKFHGVFDRTEPRTPADVVQQTEESLRSLRTDYIDIQQYHSWGDEQFFQEDVLAELIKLRDHGKIRYIGNSVGSNSNVTQIRASESRQIDVIQIIYNRLDRIPETTTFPICLEQNLGVLARVPLASGFLSGKYKPGASFPTVDPRSKWKDVHSDTRLIEVERILKDEVPANLPMARWALAWCLNHPAVTVVIPGCKDQNQVRENAAAVELINDDHRQSVIAMA